MKVTETLLIDESELQEAFIRASGPGGQNVNKVSSAVQLRFDIQNSPSLSEEVKHRLIRLGRNRVTKDGVLIILAQRFRSQELNREDARLRLADLIRESLHVPKKRVASKLPRAVKEKRLKKKSHISEKKRLRRSVRSELSV